jgi:hypothetical protein
MPRAKGSHGALPSAMVYLLAHGALPPDGHPARDTGLIEAFQLKYSPTMVDDLRELWRRHADEITAATPAGGEPWVVRALASPDSTDKDEDDEEDTE